MYKRKNIESDNYYYFALSWKQYQEYLDQIEQDKTKRSHYFTKIRLYKIYDDCSISQSGMRYIFRVKLKKETRVTFFCWEVKLHHAKLFEVREPLCFKDILVSNKKYENL